MSAARVSHEGTTTLTRLNPKPEQADGAHTGWLSQFLWVCARSVLAAGADSGALVASCLVITIIRILLILFFFCLAVGFILLDFFHVFLGFLPLVAILILLLFVLTTPHRTAYTSLR